MDRTLLPALADPDTRFSTARIETDFGPCLARFQEDSLCSLLPVDAAETLAETTPAPALAAELPERIRRFLAGDASASPALRPAGTSFQRAVWEQLRKSQAGEQLTYGQLAEQLGRAGAARAVGAALARNPIAFFIPCHRVVSKGGSLTGFAWGLAMKEQLLLCEHAA